MLNVTYISQNIEKTEQCVIKSNNRQLNKRERNARNEKKGNFEMSKSRAVFNRNLFPRVT